MYRFVRHPFPIFYEFFDRILWVKSRKKVNSFSAIQRAQIDAFFEVFYNRTALEIISDNLSVLHDCDRRQARYRPESVYFWCFPATDVEVRFDVILVRSQNREINNRAKRRQDKENDEGYLHENPER